MTIFPINAENPEMEQARKGSSHLENSRVDGEGVPDTV